MISLAKQSSYTMLNETYSFIAWYSFVDIFSYISMTVNGD